MADNSSVATEYGRALFLLTEETGCTEKIKEECEALSDLLSREGDYLKLLDTPSLSKEEKLGLLDKAFSGVSEYLLNTLKILCERHCAFLAPKVLSAYVAEYEKARGIERVEAVSVAPLTAEQTARLKEKLEKITGKQIIIKNTCDPSILGGMKLRYMGIQLDGSVKTRLDAFEKSLRSVIV